MVRRLHHIILAPLLAVSILFLGMFAAYASAQAPAVGQTELCTGQGALSVHFDANGNIVTVDPGCPDCVMDHLTGLSLSSGAIEMSARLSPVYVCQAAQVAAAVDRIRAKARAPPSVCVNHC
jgi:hypothetical protein